MSELTLLEELLFGSGAYIGFILLVVLAFVLAYLYKYSAVITTFFFVFIGLKYWDLYGEGSNDFMWFTAFSFVVAVLLIFQMLRRKD